MEMECDEAGFSLWLPEPSKHHGFCQPQCCIVRVYMLQSDWRMQGRWLAGQEVSVWQGNHFTFRHGVVFVLKRGSKPSREGGEEGVKLRFHCSKLQTPQLATGEVALLCGRSDQYSNGQERRSGNAELRDCPLHSQEPCRFQTDNLGVECMYTLHCVQAARNGQTLLTKMLLILYIPLPAKSHYSYLITHVINPGCTWTAASNAAHIA